MFKMNLKIELFKNSFFLNLFKKELQNRTLQTTLTSKLKGTVTSKFKRNFTIEVLQVILQSKFKRNSTSEIQK